MLASFALPLLAFLSFVSFASSQTAEPVCSASQYSSLACLTSHHGAASLCSKIPLQTVTLTVTTTTLDVNSITLTAHATSQTTVHVTSTQMSTVYVTRGAVTTITSYKTNHKTENATITTYIPTAKVAASAETACNPEQAVSSLGSLLHGVFATACSCIGHPARTTTVTSIVNAPAVKTQTTEYAGTAPTTTIYGITMKTTTITKRPVEIVTRNKENVITSTLTVSYAAPSFTQAFGPKVACIDITSSSSKILPHSVNSLHSAAQQCKNLCSQNADCAAVYVQHMSFVRGGPKHYHCFFNDHKLDEATDLKCLPKPRKTIYGVAIGYDACDRGSEPL